MNGFVIRRRGFDGGGGIYTGTQPGCCGGDIGDTPPHRLLSGCGLAVYLDVHRSGVASVCFNSLEA